MRYFFRAALGINFIASVILYGFYAAVGPKALALFIKDASLIPMACEALRGYGFSMLPASLNIVYITYFLSTKNTARALVISCGRGVVLNSLCVFLIPVLFGPEHIWLPMIVAETTTLCTAFIVKRQHDRGTGKAALAD